VAAAAYDPIMTDGGSNLAERLQQLLSERDVPGLVALYEPDAEIVRFDGCSRGADEILDFFEQYLATHGRFDLHTIDPYRAADDIVMWDALSYTDDGVLHTSNVVVLGDDGLIRRHMPGILGYWGR